MVSKAFMIPSWLTLLLLFLSFATLLPTTCLAQDPNNGNPTATTAAPNPDPSSNTTSQPSTTSSAAAQTHTIQVGLADHKFRPEVTEANVGDTIEFHFYPANHSVVRAEYGFPCIPYEMTGSNKAGFFTGFHPVDKVLDDPPESSLTINDTDPIFFYCSAPGSCLKYGMVGAINPNASTSIDTQHQLALDSAYMLNPGEPFPAESPLPSSNPASSAVPEGSHTGKKGLGAGAIAGIVIASLSVVVLGALLFFFWGRTKTLKDEVDRKESTVTRRISPSSSAAMLETGRRNGGGGGEGLGSYQHYAQTPTPTYHSPQQQQQKYISPATSPTEYPTYSPATYIYSPSPAADMTSVQQQRATSPHHSPDGTFYSYSYPRSPPPTQQQQPFTSAMSNIPDNDLYTQYHHPHQRAMSPPSLAAAQEAKLGPYGQQQQQLIMRNSDPAPPYFETVHRPGPLHVNGRIGPAEMEGESTRAEVKRKEAEKGNEMEKEMTEEMEKERPKWEEVGVDGRKGEEGRMF